ncbi:hypothetical protein MD484_g2726, partial [Candolleomyces efflorescens]
MTLVELVELRGVFQPYQMQEYRENTGSKKEEPVTHQCSLEVCYVAILRNSLLIFDKVSKKHSTQTARGCTTTSASQYAESVARVKTDRTRAQQDILRQEKAETAERERRGHEPKRKVETSDSKRNRKTEHDPTIRTQGSHCPELNDGRRNGSGQGDYSKRVEELGRSLQAPQREVERERDELERLKRQFARTERLLEERTGELNAAKAFLRTADEYSVADVSHMVTQLNDDIYQCAAFMGDEAIDGRGIEEPWGAAHEARVVQALQELVASGFNQEWVERLRPEIREQDTILFEAMVQHTVVCWCHQIVSSFFPDRAMDECLQGVWSRVAQSANTNIAKRWYSMTMAHSQLRPQDLNAGLNHVMRNLENLMASTGWRALTAVEPRESDFITRVREKVERAREKALEIKEVVAQKILSVEIRLLCPAMGTPYNPSEMEDAYDLSTEADREKSGQRVLWATGLGVQYVARSLDGRESSEVVLRAKVGLSAPT